MITFGCQLGGGSSRVLVQPLHVELNRLFQDKDHSGEYFKSDLNHLGIYFRVEGPIKKFGDEGPSSLEYLAKTKELGIDFVVPEFVWRDFSKERLKLYIRDAVCECFNLLQIDAVNRDLIVEGDLLSDEFNSRISKFL